MRVGDIALVSDDNAPRNDWKRGIVTEVFVSRDGYVRSVRLKMGKKATRLIVPWCDPYTNWCCYSRQKMMLIRAIS